MNKGLRIFQECIIGLLLMMDQMVSQIPKQNWTSIRQRWTSILGTALLVLTLRYARLCLVLLYINVCVQSLCVKLGVKSSRAIKGNLANG